MIRTLTFVMFAIMYLATTVNASANRSYFASAPLTGIKTQPVYLPDTTSCSSLHSLIPSPNVVYKYRLDSLQKSVSLDYNEYVQAYIDIYLSRKEQVGKMLGLSKYYFPIFEKALQEAGLPAELKFMTVIESALDPHAVSRSGAVGPWQFMYTTAKGYGLVMDTYVDERKDPVKASYAAAHYFVDAYRRIGDWLLTIAAFNCGTGAVTRAISRSGGVADFWKVRPFLPRETQNYVPAFIATIYAMNYYQSHSIELRPASFNIKTDIIPVNKKISISSIAKATDLDLEELLILNPSYKKQIVNGSVEFPKPLVIPGLTNGMFASLYEVLNGFDAGSATTAGLTKTSSGLKPGTSGFHRVEEGQSLANIANQYGVEVQDLKVWNNLKTTSLVPGQNIRLSPVISVRQEKSEGGYRHYIVKVGDTLSAIANKFSGATVTKIKALNGLTRSAISPGMNLKINHL
ncbi:MAG: lytic transglycosylase domain-containing protein [Daejeonella sp.]